MRSPREIAALAVALLALFGPAPTRGQSLPASQPASQTTFPVPDLPADATVGDLQRWLADPKRSKHLTDEQIALKSALGFFIAVGEAAADRATMYVDVVGYQPLPITGRLPETPDRAAQKDAVKALIGRTARFAADQIPARRFQVLARKAARPEFPAVAEWMLPDDLVVVVRAAGAGRESGTAIAPDTSERGDAAVSSNAVAVGPLTHDAAIVVRLRARRPTIVAGTLFDCVPAAATP